MDQIMLTLFCGFLILLLLLAFSVQKKNKASASSIIPGPLKINSLEESKLLKKVGISLYVMQLHERFGPIVQFYLNDLKVVSIGGPKQFKQHQKLFDRPVELFKDLIKIIGPGSIQYANGARGKLLHKQLSRPMSFTNCSQYYDYVHQIGEEYVKDLETKPRNTKLPLQSQMFSLTMKTVCKLLYGYTFPDDESVKKVINNYKNSFFGLFYAKEDASSVDEKISEKAILEYRGFVKNTITNRLDKRHTDSNTLFIDALLELGLNKDEELDHAVSFFTGGFHTTGFLLAWLFYYLAKYPNIQENVRQELNHFLKDEPISNENINKLTYFKQVINETLRLSCLGPFAARYSAEDTMIDGYIIPANTPVVHSIGFALSDPNYWPSADEFDPTRFSSENSKDRPKLCFSPFGFAGTRICPGNQFSYTVVAVFTNLLIRRFKLNLIDGQTIDKEISFVTRPSSEIWITVEKF